MSQVNKIITPVSEINIIRNSDGLATKVIEEKNDYSLITEIIRDSQGNVLEFIKERV